jgi:hypothetical protein
VTNLALTGWGCYTDGQSERTIRILEDMLRLCILDFKGNWINFLPLVEFAYNNSFQATIGMAPYEALYGRKCSGMKLEKSSCWDQRLYKTPKTRLHLFGREC